ncbi:MAG TPA: hypothetical protein VM165_18115 [Planctomycetaceae bacterium]|nr:hypothetical protein [Planctomycetaceae bacterium]
MTTKPTNDEWAENALAVFTAETCHGHPAMMDRDDLEDAIADLICDLMHFARHRRFDAGRIIRQACGNFGAELFEKGVQS